MPGLGGSGAGTGTRTGGRWGWQRGHGAVPGRQGRGQVPVRPQAAPTPLPAIAQLPGRKDLFIEADLMSPLDRIANVSILKVPRGGRPGAGVPLLPADSPTPRPAAARGGQAVQGGEPARTQHQRPVSAAPALDRAAPRGGGGPVPRPLASSGFASPSPLGPQHGAATGNGAGVGRAVHPRLSHPCSSAQALLPRPAAGEDDEVHRR